MAQTQVRELQLSERRLLVQLYVLQSEAWEQADVGRAGDVDTESAMFIQ
jgi:hypothetical protein